MKMWYYITALYLQHHYQLYFNVWSIDFEYNLAILPQYLNCPDHNRIIHRWKFIINYVLVLSTSTLLVKKS